MIVTPGKQFENLERHNTTNTNLLGVPSVSLEDGEVLNQHLATGIDGSKVINIPVGSLDSSVQSKFGFKNYCYNPGFWHWSAGTIFTSGTTNADGWSHTMPAISYTISRQAIVAGESDSLLKQSKYFWRCTTTTTSSTESKFYNNQIKNPRLFSGQNVTVSAIVKVSSGTLPTLSFFVEQNFGSGGTPSADVRTTVAASVQPNSQWQKIYATIDVPTVNGATIGSTTDGEIRFGFVTANSSTAFQIDVANFQVETGDAATEFEDIQAQNTAALASLWTCEAGGQMKITAPGSSIAIDSRGAYWKPNVVQTVLDTTFTTSSTSFTALTGLSASITPTSTSSKVLVEVVINASIDSGGTNVAFFQLKRGSTEICIGATASSRENCSATLDEIANGNATRAVVIKFIDSPAVSTSTAYSVDLRVNTGSVYINRSRTDTDTNVFPRLPSTITLTEIPV